MDDTVHGVGTALKLASDYPDIIALIVGSLIGWVFVVMIETYFLPTETDPTRLRRQKGLTFILTWLSSGAASSILWGFLDPRDRRAERVIISYLVGILAFATYPLVGRLITRFFPSVGSAWSPRDPH
jgi:hypothetical protein